MDHRVRLLAEEAHLNRLCGCDELQFALGQTRSNPHHLVTKVGHMREVVAMHEAPARRGQKFPQGSQPTASPFGDRQTADVLLLLG